MTHKPKKTTNVLNLFFILLSSLLIITLSSCSNSSTQTDTSVIESNFVGFGADTRGGLDGQVYRVTNLNAEGEGSLKAALEAVEPRLVVFDVGGVIDLANTQIVISHPYLTLAGQTAPTASGITLIRGGIAVETHDVVIQHIRIRVGDNNDNIAVWNGNLPDALEIRPAFDDLTGEVYNVIIDHCSFSWGLDETLSVAGVREYDRPTPISPYNITISNSIIAEALHRTVSKGTLIEDFSQNISLIRNVYVHNYDRTPMFNASTTGYLANNVVYNATNYAFRFNDTSFVQNATISSPNVTAIGNLFIPGDDSVTNVPMFFGKATIYQTDNLVDDSSSNSGTLISTSAETNFDFLTSAEINITNYTPSPANSILDDLLTTVGAFPAYRDASDTRILSELENRTGRVKTNQADADAYPSSTITTHQLSVPTTPLERSRWLNQLSSQI